MAVFSGFAGRAVNQPFRKFTCKTLCHYLGWGGYYFRRYLMTGAFEKFTAAAALAVSMGTGAVFAQTAQKPATRDLKQTIFSEHAGDDNKSELFKPDDAFSLDPFPIRGCDPQYKGTELKIVLTPSNTDIAAQANTALPEKLRSLSDEDFTKAMDAMPEAEATAVIAAFAKKMNAIEAPLMGLVLEGLPPEVYSSALDNYGLDRQKVMEGLGPELQKFADNFERVTGISIALDIEIKDYPALDATCAAKKKAPAP
jgi:hypothetical protein